MQCFGLSVFCWADVQNQGTRSEFRSRQASDTLSMLGCLPTLSTSALFFWVLLHRVLPKRVSEDHDDLLHSSLARSEAIGFAESDAHRADRATTIGLNVISLCYYYTCCRSS